MFKIVNYDDGEKQRKNENVSAQNERPKEYTQLCEESVSDSVVCLAHLVECYRMGARCGKKKFYFEPGARAHCVQYTDWTSNKFANAITLYPFTTLAKRANGKVLHFSCSLLLWHERYYVRANEQRWWKRKENHKVYSRSVCSPFSSLTRVAGCALRHDISELNTHAQCTRLGASKS